MHSKKNQIDAIVSFIKNGEKQVDEHKLGVEIEHFVVHKDTLKAVSYYENGGIKYILEEMLRVGWEPIFEDGHLMSVKKNGMAVTLEPGGQIEVSIQPELKIKNIENCYLDFAKDIISIAERKDMALINLGYQPVTAIKDIEMIPKKRYEYMYDYFKSTGKYAHNMMKATASIQVSIDYENEQDYMIKNKVANFLSPIIYYIFDNVPFFEGEVCEETAMRSIIWSNCDNNRCGYPEGIFYKDFNYTSYAQYLLDIKPIVIRKNGAINFTGDSRIRDVFNPQEYTEEELEYIMTMAFPNVRTKKFIEIRMGDSLPYPYCFAYIALWKGIMYNKYNLESLYKRIENKKFDNLLKLEETFNINADINNDYLWKTFSEIFELARLGLNEDEKDYLTVIEKMVVKRQTLKEKVLSNLHRGKKKAVEISMLNKVVGGGA